eukprot:2783744-Alexandrium_andersonii.AAC.1
MLKRWARPKKLTMATLPPPGFRTPDRERGYRRRPGWRPQASEIRPERETWPARRGTSPARTGNFAGQLGRRAR